ncbi:fibronectin type III domain-containing protein [Actinomadura sp. NPDC047616]|uniref:fibronectin type III domain-containing protein n=1 Tax=Actinomadura sp. NPDC047616 TaxID=3155914 RepID=UPI0033EE1A09
MRRTRKAGLPLALAGALVAGSTLYGVPVAHAASGTLSLDYRCDYPLLGLQDVRVQMTVDNIPDNPKVNEEIKGLPITAKATIPAATVEGLRTINAAKLTGFATAEAVVTQPGFPAPNIAPRVGFDPPTVDIPTSGDFTINTKGTSPSLSFTKAGWGEINVGNLTLRVTPLDASGQQTSLGQLNVKCYQKPGQKNSLVQFYVDDGTTPQPPKPAPTTLQAAQPPVEYGRPTYQPNVHKYDLTYTCDFPILGPSDEKGILKVRAEVDFPDKVKVNDYAPRIKIVSTNVLGANAVDALTQVSAVKLTKTTAYARADMTVPQYASPVKATVALPVPDTDIPQDYPSPPMTINATGQAPALVFTKAGSASMSIGNIDLETTPVQADGTPTQLGNVKAPCVKDPADQISKIDFEITDGGGPAPDTQAPTIPGNVKVEAGVPASSSLTVSWDASTDKPDAGASGVGGYLVFRDGQQVADVKDGTSYTDSGLQAETEYKYGVVAYDKAGNKSEQSSPVSGKTGSGEPAPDTQAPTVPGNVKVEAGVPASSSLTVSWDASTDKPDAGASGVGGYLVFRDGQQVADVKDGTSYTDSGLQAETEYKYGVVAYDKAGNKSEQSSPVSGKTGPGSTTPPTSGAFELSGSSSLKAANGKVALAGSVSGTVDAGGNVSADLKLKPATGAFSILGFLPVTADIAFAPQGRTTGTLSGGTLSTTTKTVVKVSSVKLFGIQIGGGSTCQTGSAATIPLRSTDFTVAGGGTLTGTYTLPALQGCGVLTPLLSAFVAGPGNTVTLRATPAK